MLTDHQAARTAVAAHLPFGDPADLEPIGEGDYCLAFALGAHVIRVARHAEAARAIERETCLLPRIAPALPLPVPLPTYYAASPDSPAFTIHERIHGDALSRDIWTNMPERGAENTAQQLAEFLRALHALPLEAGIDCGLPELDASKEARRLRDAASQDLYRLLGRVNAERLDATLDAWAAPARSPERRVLLHCDIAPDNVLCDTGAGSSRITGVIDFGDLAIGSPAREFTYIYEDYGHTILARVLRHYTGRDDHDMLPAIRQWFLLQTLQWTLEMSAARKSAELHHGLSTIVRELQLSAL